MNDVTALLDREVFLYQLAAITDEMSAAIRRAAFSPIIWDMSDYCCALISTEGEVISQADTIPAQLGILPSAYAGITAVIPLEEWRLGDVVICNDPYRGCTHTPDLVLMSPIFVGNEIVALAAAVAHHVDIGGKLPSTTAPDNVEVFGEGLQFPPMKLVSEGIPNKTAYTFISGNVRNPRACIGDLAAQIAGCRTGEKRFAELIDAYGVERVKLLVDEALSYGERYSRAAIAALPQRSSYAEVFIEDDVSSDMPTKLAVLVTVKGDSIDIDFEGTDAQRRNALNCPVASTLSMALYAVRCITGGGGPNNGGRNRPITIHVPEGSILHPLRPAAVGNRHFTQQAVADVVLKALVEIAPQQSAAACHISFPTMRAGGFDTRKSEQGGSDRRYFIMHDIIGGGMGGNPNSDGVQAVDTHGGNCGVLSAEVIESNGPVRVLRSELIPGSGGDGCFRGGLAVRRDYELLVDDVFVSVFYQQGSAKTAPWGARGGQPGGLARALVNPGRPGERTLSSKETGMSLRSGDVVRLESAGGGGWGDPQDRAESLRERDVAQHYIT